MKWSFSLWLSESIIRIVTSQKKTCKIWRLKKYIPNDTRNTNLHYIIPDNTHKKWWIKQKKSNKVYKIVLYYFLSKGFWDFFIAGIDLRMQIPSDFGKDTFTYRHKKTHVVLKDTTILFYAFM